MAFWLVVVAGDRGVAVGDGGDEPFPEAVAAELGRDGEEEDVAVAARRGEREEVVVLQVAVDRRATVGVGEEPPSLLEDALLVVDAFFEVPRLVDVLVVTGVDHVGLYVDAHYRG